MRVVGIGVIELISEIVRVLLAFKAADSVGQLLIWLEEVVMNIIKRFLRVLWPTICSELLLGLCCLDSPFTIIH